MSVMLSHKHNYIYVQLASAGKDGLTQGREEAGMGSNGQK